MLDLTFGEQVKIILSRKGMTIKELAETIEKRTGKKMSRQNLTQRLGRDNFQEQDMRMIADILGCPFKLSILADSQAVEKASTIEEVIPTEKELSKIARAKEKKDNKENKDKEKKDKKPELAPKVTETERDITIGELVDIHKELDELIEKTGRLPEIPESVAAGPAIEIVETAAEEPAEDIVNDAVEDTTAEKTGEFDEPAIQIVEEASDYEAVEEEHEDVGQDVIGQRQADSRQIEEDPEDAYVQEEDTEPEVQEEAEVSEPKEEKRSKGWRAYFQRRGRKAEPAKPDVMELNAGEEDLQETEEDDYIEYESFDYEEEYEAVDEDYEEDILEEEIQEIEPEEEFIDDEDLEIGEVNPATGHEYETNSVRTHPKRIGYVQVYDRSDHRWTDMTEWAFLGYQERKKALLGKDYEAPIYLD